MVYVNDEVKIIYGYRDGEIGTVIDVDTDDDDNDCTVQFDDGEIHSYEIEDVLVL